MVLTCTPFHRRYNGFRFETWWLQMPGFKELVQQAWAAPVRSNNRARVLHIKLARLARALKRWNRERLTLLRQESDQASSQVLQLDQLQETRLLIEQEIQDQQLAKSRILGLAAVRKIKLRQRSRLTLIRVGDSNTRLFHLRANTRRRKNYIPVLQHDQHTCITHKAKAEALHHHYSDQFGPAAPRTCTLNWSTLSMP
jgi:hypothetical protein